MLNKRIFLKTLPKISCSHMTRQAPDNLTALSLGGTLHVLAEIFSETQAVRALSHQCAGALIQYMILCGIVRNSECHLQKQDDAQC